MLTTELHEAAVDFGRALRHSPVLTIYHLAAEALDADPAARALMADLREQVLAVTRVQQAGLAPSEEQLDHLRLCQASVRANGVIMAHLRATNEVKAFLPTVAREVNGALGADYAAMIAPTNC